MSREPLVSGSVTIGFEHAIVAAGGSASQLMRLSGLGDDLLNDPFSDIPLRRFVSLLEQSSAETGDDAFGLTFGANYLPGDLGPIGELVMNAATLGQAFRLFADYVGAVQEDTELAFATEEGSARISYRVLDPSIWPRRQDAEFSLTVFTKILRHALGPDWGPTQVWLEHARPAASDHHRRFFRAPVLFNMPTNAIFFPAGLMDRPMPAGNMTLLGARERQLQAILEGRARQLPFVEEVRRAIVIGLMDGVPNAAAVADNLGLSERTLSRRLAGAGATFRETLGEVRLQIARNYLEQPNVSVTETAYLLGYSDLSAFNRAFKAWTGVSPGRYRDHTKGH